MKIKGFIIFGAIISIIGLILMIVSITIISTNPDKLYLYEKENKKTEIVEVIDSIDIEFKYIGVSVIKKDVSKIEINHFESKYSKFDIIVDNNTLVIKENVIKKMPWYTIGLSLGFDKDPIVEIYIPNDYIISSNAKTKYGDIKYQGEFNDVNIECNGGSVMLDHLTCNDLYVKNNAGKIRLNDANMNDLKIEMNAGNIKLNCVQANIVEINNNAGNIKLDNLITNKIILNIDAGDIDFNSLISSDIKIDMNAGDIDGTIKGIKSEYTIIINKDAGRSNLSNQIGSTSNKIDIKINAGDIDIEFI